MIDNIRTGQNIIFHRQKLGWTQGELASRLNVTHQAVSKWENGNAFPDITILYELSRLFGVTMETLLTGDPAAAKEHTQTDSFSIEAADNNTTRRQAAMESDNAPCRAKDDAVPEASDATFSEPSKVQHSSISEYSWDQIMSLAPFASRDTLSHLVDRCQEECDFDHICSLAPFLDQRTIDRLILNGSSGLSAHSADGCFPYDEAEKRAAQKAERVMQQSFRKAEKMAEQAARKAEEMAERSARKAERIAERAARRAEQHLNGMEDIGDTIAAHIEEFIFQEISSASEAAHDIPSKSGKRPDVQTESTPEKAFALSDRRTEIVDAGPSASLTEYAEHVVSILYGACDADDPLFERIHEILIALLAQDYAALNEFAPLLDRIIGPEWLVEYAELCDDESGIPEDSADYEESDTM